MLRNKITKLSLLIFFVLNLKEDHYSEVTRSDLSNTLSRQFRVTQQKYGKVRS